MGGTPPPRRHGMVDKTSVLLCDNRHFIRFLFPFPLRETPPPRRPAVGRRFTERGDAVEHCATNIVRTGHWQPHEGSKPDYILPYVETFLLPEAQVSTSERYVFAYQLRDQILQ